MFLDLSSHAPLCLQPPTLDATEPQVSPDELGSPLFYVSFNRWMTRQWKAGMSYAERAILDFVFDRTVGWGKEWEGLPLRHIASGFEGDALTSTKGTGLSKPAIIPALNHLLSLGVLRKQKGSGRVPDKFAINFNWTPNRNTPTYRHAMLKLPKNHPQNQSDEGRSGKVALPMRSSSFTRKRDTNKESNQESATQTGEPPSGAPLPSRLDSIVNEIKKQGEKRADKAKASTRFTVASLTAVFQSEWVSAFPETPVVAWKQHEGFALKQWGARYQASTKASFSELFAWCVSRWRQVMAHDFKTFKNAPAFPAVGFMVKFSERFQDAYARRAELERRASMTERDTAIERAKDKGMDGEAAERHADERLGLQEQKDAITRERRRLLAQQLAVPRIIVAPAVVGVGVGAARVQVANDFKHKPSLSDMIGRGDEEFQPYEADALR